MALLITATEVRTARPELSTGVKEVKINTYIQDAEIKYLRPYLGEAFYQAIKDAVAAEATTYDDLLNGQSYTYSGYAYSHPGLKDVLARFAFALYNRYGYVTDTPFGTLSKQNDNARELGRSEREAMFKENERMAHEQWLSVRAYLNRNSNSFPLWTDCQVQNFSISKISKR